MKLIAHRGLTKGPNKSLENQPYQIQSSIERGYDCEVDLWVFEDRLYLGHDGPQYNITEHFLKQSGLWIHCKNLAAMEFCGDDIKLNYFWHENDSYTLTSKGFIWAYPGKALTKFSIMVLPEWNDPELLMVKSVDCFGVCTDYVEMLDDK